MSRARNVSLAAFPVSLRAAGMFLHRWLGLTAGLVFVIAGLTGSLLAYSEPLEEMLYPELAAELPAGWEDHRSDVLQRIHDEGMASGGARLVRFPSESRGVYEIFLDDQRIEYRDAISGDVVLERSHAGDIIEFAQDLHIHLLAGETGELVLGWIGVGMLALLITGIWTWWPRRGMWRFAFRYPQTQRVLPKIFWWHKTAGIVAVPVVLFVTLTGVSMVFYAQAQSVLTGLFGGEPLDVPATHERAPGEFDWQAIVHSMDVTLPEGRTVYFYMPLNDSDTVRLRKKMPAELHPNGRSFIAMTRAGEVVHANDATQMKAGMRATHAIYPLHSAKTGSDTWRFVVALAGLLPLGFFITGFWIWRKKPGR